jgi:hypothetical protein
MIKHPELPLTGHRFAVAAASIPGPAGTTRDPDRGSRVRTSRLPPLTPAGSIEASGAPEHLLSGWVDHDMPRHANARLCRREVGPGRRFAAQGSARWVAGGAACAMFGRMCSAAVVIYCRTVIHEAGGGGGLARRTAGLAGRIPFVILLAESCWSALQSGLVGLVCMLSAAVGDHRGERARLTGRCTSCRPVVPGSPPGPVPGLDAGRPGARRWGCCGHRSGGRRSGDRRTRASRSRQPVPGPRS